MTLASDDRPGMLAAARRSAIVEQVRRHGTARVTELAGQLGVSHITIRRDIDVLADAGSLEKIHGGAKLPENLSHDEPGFEKKVMRQDEEKRAIAATASTLVIPGMVVGLSAGTTTFALAKELRDIPELTIVTNSILIANVFHHRTMRAQHSSSVILTGGERTPSDALVGPVASSSLRQLHVDLLFLGVHGADEQAGLTTPNLLESETNQVFISAARRVIVLADHTKWGTVGISTMAPLDAADVFVTDSNLDAHARSVLGERVGELIVAELG